MFDSFRSWHLDRERRVFIKSRKQGKRSFAVWYAIAIGGAIFSLLHAVVDHYVWAGHILVLGPGGMVAVDVLGIPLCLGAGYGIGCLRWRRGLRLTNKTG